MLVDWMPMRIFLATGWADRSDAETSSANIEIASLNLGIALSSDRTPYNSIAVLLARTKRSIDLIRSSPPPVVSVSLLAGQGDVCGGHS